MRNKSPKAIHETLEKWARTPFYKKAPTYIGEWMMFLWPSRTKPHNLVGYRLVRVRGRDVFHFICSCEAFGFTPPNTRLNGDECPHVRELAIQLQEKFDELSPAR